MNLSDDLTLISTRTNAAPKNRASRLLIRGFLVLFTLAIVIIVGGFIAGPALFRLLPDQYQGGLARRVPMLAAWIPTDTPAPTRVYSADTLPTTDPNRAAAAMALLSVSTQAATQSAALTPTQMVIQPDMLTATPISAPTLVPQSVALLPTNSAAPSLIAATLVPTLLASPTMIPTTAAIPANAVATLSAVPNASPAATDAPLPPALHLDGYKVIYQTWNNCGPANLAQVLNAYGMNTSQKETASWLKPNANDANVSPWQIAAYVNQYTKMRAVQRVNGNLGLLKKLLAANFKPIIETGFSIPSKPEEGWMGHYLTPVGYDDGQGALFGMDSYLGDGPNKQGRLEAYADLDTRWQQFNRTYVVVYPAERENELRALLGTDSDVTINAQGALAKARQEAQADPSNAYAWFNMGSSYVLLHDFKNAASAYDQSRNAGKGLPWRMLWYQFGPFAAYYGIGDYRTASALIEATLGTTHNVEEVYYWRGMVESAQGKTQSATVDLQYVLQFNPNYHFAADALTSLKANQTPTPPDVP